LEEPVIPDMPAEPEVTVNLEEPETIDYP